MPIFAVILERGPRWDWERPMRRQDGWDEHAAFMDALVRDGFVLAGGPLGDEDLARRVLHVVNAASPHDVEEALALDPWSATQQLVTVSVDPWNVLLGTTPTGASDRP